MYMYLWGVRGVEEKRVHVHCDMFASDLTNHHLKGAAVSHGREAIEGMVVVILLIGFVYLLISRARTHR